MTMPGPGGKMGGKMDGEMNPDFAKVEMHEVNENHSEILKYHVSKLS